MQPEVKTAVEAAVAQLEALGAQVVPISLPNTDKALPVYYLVATAEASANLARFDGVRFGYSAHADSMFENFRQSRGEGFGPEVKRRIMLGTYALSAGYYDAYYLKAQQVRTLIKQDFERAFEAVDVIACPGCPDYGLPHRRKDGQSARNVSDGRVYDHAQPGRDVRDQRAVRLRQGGPADRPAARSGRTWAKRRILRTAHAYEQATDWHTYWAQV